MRHVNSFLKHHLIDQPATQSRLIFCRSSAAHRTATSSADGCGVGYTNMGPC